jgi:hypothetical protein
MSNNGIARVHYFERQFLRTQDFADEQVYHLAMRRRHNIAHHTWGIVHGLQVVPEEGNLFVQPGLAVDGYGRELILPEKQPLSTAAFAGKGSDILDVWLVYDRVGSAPQGYAGCGDDGDAPFYRWQERPLIRLDVPDPAFPNRRQPESVPQGDLDFDPSRTPPDDPQEDWPVFLGQIRFDPANPDQPYSVDLADRPYVGLVGEAIDAPSGRARVQIGAELDTDPRRFAVFVPEADPGVHPSPARLEIKDTGEIGVRGQTTLYGDLKVAGGAVEFGAGVARSAQPWHLYHHQDEDINELRLEMAAGSNGLNQVVVGYWSSEEEAFKPCLTIADNCIVTVHGNLVVEGQIEFRGETPSQLDTVASQFALSSFLSGVGGANILLGRGSLGGTPALFTEGLAALRRAAVSEEELAAFVTRLETDETLREAFLNLLSSGHPNLLQGLQKSASPGDDDGDGGDEG